jgi:hypothetical protein
LSACLIYNCLDKAAHAELEERTDVALNTASKLRATNFSIGIAMTSQNSLPDLRLMIEISPELHDRIKIVAAQKDLSIHEYIEQILEEAVPREEASALEHEPRPVSRESVERVLEAREQIMQERGGRPFTDSTEIIRLMREERSQHLGEL